jgi:hypothetical protein
MPETPDFDQMALRIVKRLDTAALDDTDLAYNSDIVRGYFRLVWNARGAADLAVIGSLMMSDSRITAEILKLDR